MQIRPQESFPIVYLLSDPNDTGTYYVRSVLRNSATGVVIQINGQSSVNLTVDASNSRRFSKLIQAPNDSGQGLYIDVTTTVYTDSGYTTKSDVYREQLDTHLVAERWQLSLSGAGGGWKSEPVDYKLVAATLLEALTPLVSNDRLISLMEGLEEGHSVTQELIRGIDIPEPKEIDLKSHTQSILAALKEHLEPFKKINWEPVLKHVERHSRAVIKAVDEKSVPDSLNKDEMKIVLAPLFKQVTDMLDGIKKILPQEQFASFTRDIADVVRARPANRGASERVRSLL